jgi:hypothetical protein
LKVQLLLYLKLVCACGIIDAMVAARAQGLDQVGSLHAETALAHDDMVAAGGPEDSFGT